MMLPTIADDLSMYGCLFWICVSLLLCPSVLMELSSLGSSDTCNSTMFELPGCWVNYCDAHKVNNYLVGPMRSTHNAYQGVVMASLAGSFPYLFCLHLFT